MLTVIRNDIGKLQSACEWHLVNETGQLCADGKYVWLEQFELSQGALMAQCAKQLIEEIANRCPWTIAVYWRREDKPMIPKIQFNRATVLRYVKKGVLA